jgi:hypothetical protein
VVERTRIGELAGGEVPLVVYVTEAPADGAVDGDPMAWLPCVEISGDGEPVYLSADDAAWLGRAARPGRELRVDRGPYPGRPPGRGL